LPQLTTLKRNGDYPQTPNYSLLTQNFIVKTHSQLLAHSIAPQFVVCLKLLRSRFRSTLPSSSLQPENSSSFRVAHGAGAYNIVSSNCSAEDTLLISLYKRRFGFATLAPLPLRKSFSSQFSLRLSASLQA